jgi:outer membrane biosynthesis protein TonB
MAHPSAVSILLGGEVDILATPAALSTREITPAADEKENEQIEEPRASKEKKEEGEEKHEERPRVEDAEEREERPKKEKSPKKEEKKVARIKVDGDEGKVDMLKEVMLESSPSYYLPGHHT